MKEIVGNSLLHNLEEEKLKNISLYNKKKELYLKKSKEKLILLNDNDKLKLGKSLDMLKNKVSHIKRIIKRKKTKKIKQFIYKESIVLGISTIVASLSGLYAITALVTILASTEMARYTYKQFQKSIHKDKKDLSILQNRIRKINDKDIEIDFITNELGVIRLDMDILNIRIKDITSKISEIQNNRLIELNEQFQNFKFSSPMKGKFNKEKNIIELYPVQEEKIIQKTKELSLYRKH